MTPAIAHRLLAAACFLAAWPGLSRQTAPTATAPPPPSAPPAFEVASVKLNTSTSNAIGNKFGPDSMRWTNTPLKILIEEVYGLKDYQVLGGPAWTDSDRWDIDAKAASPASLAEKMKMLGALLADRFQLRFHRETRQLPVYRLTVAKGGPKLAQAKEQDANHRWGTRAGPESLLMNGTSIGHFAWWLSAQLNQPIVESTGLTGTYDLKLEWAQDDAPAPDADASPEAARQPILGAVEFQLGLKLEPARGPVEVLIIDHVEKASAN